MFRIFTPYEKNQLLKYHLRPQLPETDHTPVEYLTSRVEFNGLDFFVDSNTLIPRPETEEIVKLAKDLKPSIVVEVGCGSGALGISLSHQLLKKQIRHQLYLSDISKKALSVSQKNAKKLLPSNLQPIIIHSDLLQGFPEIKIDLLVANLPYIPTSRIPTLDPSVKDHEPHLALDGGPKGTVLIQRLLDQVKLLKFPPTTVILEIDHTHTLKNFSLPENYQTEMKKDQFGQNRFLILNIVYN